MTTQNLALFKGLTAKMGYLNHRQSVIAQNIANSDTPGYLPKDLTEPSFDKVLKAVDKSRSSSKISMAAPSEGHMAGSKGEVDLSAKNRKLFMRWHRQEMPSSWKSR